MSDAGFQKNSIEQMIAALTQEHEELTKKVGQYAHFQSDFEHFEKTSGEAQKANHTMREELAHSLRAEIEMDEVIFEEAFIQILIQDYPELKPADGSTPTGTTPAPATPAKPETPAQPGSQPNPTSQKSSKS